MKYQDCAEAAADDDGSEAPVCEALRLAAANINPATGLATDYLNHFNEAIMLLEMLPSGDDFRTDFLRWQPVSYRDHFAGSRSGTADTALAAYEHADPQARACLLALTDTMTALLQAAHAGLAADPPPPAAEALAWKTAAALKPLIARAGAVINGEVNGRGGETPQAAVDELMKA
ncbi:MAG TPA: hypothetical protein VE224_10945 [Pseudolabrys sp.]|nr:hypothetical protein [Pseudolabrys sp.]